MIVTAWNNGSHISTGAGYGLKLDGSSVIVSINVAKASFWDTTCRELINAEIGRWLIRNNLAPWAKGIPPKLTLLHVGSNRFLLKRKSH